MISSGRVLAPRTTAAIETARRRICLSRIGELELAASPRALTEIRFLHPGTCPPCDNDGLYDQHPILDAAETYLRAFDAAHGKGERSLPPVPALDLSGCSAFTRAVLAQTAAIAWGQTRSYGQISHRLGKPGGARAVGQALSRNPLPIVIPCHRILGSAGLGGFTPRVALKVVLLEIEGSIGRDG